MHKEKKVAFLLFLLPLWLSAGPIDETIKAFESRPDYVRPFSTIVGSMTNSGWYQSASISKHFNFGVSLPISVIYLVNKDREYSGSYTDPNCATCREQEAAGASVNCRGCIECQQFTAPTIFGSIHRPNVVQYRILENGSVHDAVPVDPPFSDGIEELNQIAGLPFATLQASFSLYHTELTLRYMGMPEIAGISLHLPGVGLRYDFQHFLPVVPVSLSLAANFTILTAAWTPDEEDIEGTLKLNGLSNFLGIVAGYQPKQFLEIFLETGWEHSFLTPSGELTVKGDLVRPTKTITGRNGFRAALNIAFPIKYNPVIGGIAGSQFGYFINIFSFRSKKEE